MVKISDIVTAVEATVLHKGKEETVKWVVSSGLMSDVLTTEKEEILLVSSLSTNQVVRTADMVGAHAILIACGKVILPETVILARQLDITLLSCKAPVFETNCMLAPLFYR
jgi:hypothetical protein